MGDIFSGIFNLGGNPGSITGGITKAEIKEVKTGEYLDLDVAFNGSNPGANYWKLFLVAMDSVGNKELVQATRVIGSSFTKTDKYRLWKMPSQGVNVEIRLYGHDEAGYRWNWADWK